MTATQINTKALIKALRKPTKQAELGSTVRSEVSRMLGVGFVEPRYGDYRPVLKLAPGYPETVPADRVRTLIDRARQLGAPTDLIDAAHDALNDAPDNDETAGQPVDAPQEVPVDTVLALFRAPAGRYGWCSDAEDVIEEHLVPLKPYRDGRERFTPRDSASTSVSRQVVERLVRHLESEWANTDGVRGLIDEINRNVLGSATTAPRETTQFRESDTVQRPARPYANYEVTVTARLTRDQLRAVGLDSSRDLAGQRFSYNGVSGTVTAANGS